jgi:hypothetical protein
LQESFFDDLSPISFMPGRQSYRTPQPFEGSPFRAPGGMPRRGIAVISAWFELTSSVFIFKSFDKSGFPIKTFGMTKNNPCSIYPFIPSQDRN